MSRADFADSEQIEELLAWTHPYLSSSAGEVVFTEAENATMLRLPRRECTYIFPQGDLERRSRTSGTKSRHCLSTREPSALPVPTHAPLLLRLRRTYDAARSDSRERMDDRRADARVYRSRPANKQWGRRRRSTVVIGHRGIAGLIVPPRARLSPLPVLGNRRGVPHGRRPPPRPRYPHRPALSSRAARYPRCA